MISLIYSKRIVDMTTATSYIWLGVPIIPHIFTLRNPRINYKKPAVPLCRHSRIIPLLFPHTYILIICEASLQCNEKSSLVGLSNKKAGAIESKSIRLYFSYYLHV